MLWQFSEFFLSLVLCRRQWPSVWVCHMAYGSMILLIYYEGINKKNAPSCSFGCKSLFVAWNLHEFLLRIALLGVFVHVLIRDSSKFLFPKGVWIELTDETPWLPKSSWLLQKHCLKKKASCACMHNFWKITLWPPKSLFVSLWPNQLNVFFNLVLGCFNSTTSLLVCFN